MWKRREIAVCCCCYVELTLTFDVHGANYEGVNEVSREMGMTHSCDSLKHVPIP